MLLCMVRDVDSLSPDRRRIWNELWSGMFRFVPDSAPGVCAGCQAHIWITPNNVRKALEELDKGMPVFTLCPLCLFPDGLPKQD